MKNVILSMLAKISAMDAETKQLTAQVEAQSLMIGALMLAISKEGGITEMIGSVNKAINSVLDSSDDRIKSDAELLLSKFHEQIELTQLIEKFDVKISDEAIEGFAALPDDTHKNA